MKKTTNFELTDDSDALNKTNLDEKLKKIDAHISNIEKGYNENKLSNKKGLLSERPIRTTIQNS